MRKKLKDYLFEQWRKNVETKYVFRGMSSKDLQDPLDPSVDPFKEVRSKMDRLVGVLERLIDSGFRFTVHEEDSGMSFDLRDIVLWSKRDLGRRGIDFTTSYESACGYAKNFEGSQLKQNFRYITAHLGERISDPVVQSVMDEENWRLVSEVKEWVSRVAAEHKAVVIWVRRSCPAFESGHNERLSNGSFEYFCQKVLGRVEMQRLGSTIESAEEVLAREPGEFSVRLLRPLRLEQVKKVEEV